MSDTQKQIQIKPATTREERYGVTRKKHVTLTVDGHDRIQEWAEAEGLTFSAAIESLALVGMGSDAASAFSVLTTGLLERVVNRQFNRFAKLISQAAIAAESANRKNDILLLQLIRREAEADPEGFVQTMKVSTDPDDLVAAQIRRMRDELAELARQAAVRRLKRPLQDVEVLLTREEGDDA